MHWLQRVFAPQNRSFIIYVLLLAVLTIAAEFYRGHHIRPPTLAQVKAKVRQAVTDKNELSKLKMERSTIEFQLPNLRLKHPVLTNAVLAREWQRAVLLSQTDNTVCQNWRAYLDQVSPVVQEREPALGPYLALQQGYELEVESMARDPFIKDKAARLMGLRTNKFAALFTQPTYVADDARFQKLAQTLADERTLAMRGAYQQAMADSVTNSNPRLTEYGCANLDCELKTNAIQARLEELKLDLGETDQAAFRVQAAGSDQATFSGKDLLSRGFFQTYVPERGDFISLELATALLGLVLTAPVELRDRRWLKIGTSLVLVFLCLLALRIPVGLNLAERGTNVFAFFGFLVPAALLAGVWAPDCTFFFSKLVVQLIDSSGPEETEDTRLSPAYEAARSGNYRQALKLLKTRLLLDPWDYETLVLKAKLHRRLNRSWRTRRTLKKLLRNPRLDPAQRETVHHMLRNLDSKADACWSLARRQAPREDFEELSVF